VETGLKNTEELSLYCTLYRFIQLILPILILPILILLIILEVDVMLYS